MPGTREKRPNMYLSHMALDITWKNTSLLYTDVNTMIKRTLIKLS